ncbi:MAG: hypothetical protein Q8R35_00780 [bacterium]|nr:hypothetical protein [bacterium]
MAGHGEAKRSGPSTVRLLGALLMLAGCFFAIGGILAVLPPHIAHIVLAAIWAVH